jgi:Spy/CpxP family protein refolding chaperone
MTMKTLTTLALGLLLSAGALGLSTPAGADPQPRWERGAMHEEMMSGGVHEHMPHGRYSAMHGGGCGRDAYWMSDLSDQQRKDMDKLRLEYTQQKALLKGQILQAKTELAVLITNDAPNKSDIGKKIDQIATLKKNKLQLKTDHYLQVRKLLTAEQRVKFDMHVLKKFTGRGGWAPMHK